MKPTFLEKFGKIYTYPYGNSFMQDPVQQNIEQQEFERYVQKKRNFRPFHMECKVTKRRLCYCPNSSVLTEQSKVQMQLQQNVAADLVSYFEGYPVDFETKMKNKLLMEKERLMHVQKEDFADTFEKYLDYLDEDDLKDFDTQMKSQRKECSYCKQTIYDNTVTQSWKSEKGDQVLLCSKCSQNYISGLIDPGSENKKVARYIATSINAAKTGKPTQLPTKPGQQQIPNKPQTSGQNSSNLKSSAKKANTNGKGEGLDICSLCEKKVIPSEEAKSLKCFRCLKMYHSTCHQPPLNTELVKRFQWECSDCKTCKNCNQNNDEDKIIICDMCDKAVHIHCLNPPLFQIPSHNWFCKDCVNCLSCDKELGPISQKSQGLWCEGIYRMCKDCNYQLQQGNFCKVCRKSYSQDSNEDFIQCDECQDWIHAACDGFDSEKLAKMKDDEKYSCPICKKSKDGKSIGNGTAGTAQVSQQRKR
eukprot:403362853